MTFYQARDRPWLFSSPNPFKSFPNSKYERNKNRYMKNFKKAIALCLSLMLILSFPVSASAVEPNDPTENVLIDEDRTGSLTIYKYDITNAEKDGVWDSSYVSTGRYDETGVNNILGGTNRAGDSDSQSDLGSGEVSYGYAIKGVEFSYLRIADIVQFTESTADNRTDNHVEVLYGIDKVKGADFLKALGLENGAKRYTNADHLNENQYFYQSDVLIDALAAGLEANSTTVKTAMENYISANGGTAMPLTDSYGKTEAHDLELDLYLLVETKVPEMVTSTTDPFLVSVPMTTVNGNNAEDGGERWFYDITLYPKNLTGIPSLEKTLRENFQDTGKHDGSTTDITDGYAHTGTASAGDIVDYQIISTLPSITSEATYIDLGFVDTLSKGLSYTKGDVVLEIFKDAGCTDLVTTWKEADGFFTAAYNTTDAGESVMTIDFTERGLAEINTSKAVYSSASNVNSGFSDCTLRITYTAKVDSDNSVVSGDASNPNEVVMLWKRTSENYYDTLVDDAHIYTYGMDLTKLFSDGKGDFSNVQFIVQNDTDRYYIQAELNEAEGIYYVVDHTNNPDAATRFVPVESNGNPGKVIIKGMEDDTYTVTEIRTDNGYTLLKDDIEIVISKAETTSLCDIYESDVLGLIQNDPRYATIINDTGDLKNMPQVHLEHHLLTASATVDGNAVNMLEDNGSANAEAPLSVVNTRGFDLPETGDHGTFVFTIVGILMMAGAATFIVLASKKRNAR